jgi:hypothetical protein
MNKVNNTLKELSDEEIQRYFDKYAEKFKDDPAAAYAHVIINYGISPSKVLKMAKGFCKQTLYNKINSLLSGDGIRKQVFFIILIYNYTNIC